MKKLLLTVIAGAVCGVFGSAYAETERDRIHIAQASPTGTPPSSEKGMKTPSQIEDSRMDPAKGGAKGMKGGAAAGSSTTGAASTSTGATSSATTGTDTGATETRKSRRAARREKG